jgi:hypothetical protein
VLGAVLDEFEIHPAIALREVRNATADQHRVDPWPGRWPWPTKGIRGEVAVAGAIGTSLYTKGIGPLLRV